MSFLSPTIELISIAGSFYPHCSFSKIALLKTVSTGCSGGKVGCEPITIFDVALRFATMSFPWVVLIQSFLVYFVFFQYYERNQLILDAFLHQGIFISHLYYRDFIARRTRLNPQPLGY